MKILVPELVISETEGFTPEKDIFNRKAFGTALLNLVENTDGELVLALDAPWGEGKTTFIQMWRGLLLENDVQSIYFDAFKNDFHNDPFLVLASEIYGLIEKGDDEERNHFKEKSAAVFKTIGRISLRVGVKALTAGVLDETALEGSGADDEASKLVDEYVSSRLNLVEEDKKSLEHFQSYLAELAVKLGNGKPIVFVIDELDRCKPPFALEILESIKHLFSVPNIVFVLSMNRTQIEESIRCEYGRNVDATKYMQKFISLWASLPKARDRYGSDTKKYLSDCLSRMNFEVSARSSQVGKEVFEELIEHYDLSLREIERSLSNFAVIYNIRGNLLPSYQAVVMYLSIIKVKFPDSYRKLVKQSVSYDNIVEETELEDLTSDRDELPFGNWFKWVLFCSLSSHSEITSYLHNHGFKDSQLGLHSDISIKEISLWMENFQ